VGHWFPSETVLTRGVLLSTIPRWFHEWSVEMEIKLTGPPKGHWTTILHLTGDGTDENSNSSRIPMIHFHGSDNRPFVTSYVSGVKNKQFRIGLSFLRTFLIGNIIPSFHLCRRTKICKINFDFSNTLIQSQ